MILNTFFKILTYVYNTYRIDVSLFSSPHKSSGASDSSFPVSQDDIKKCQAWYSYTRKDERLTILTMRRVATSSTHIPNKLYKTSLSNYSSVHRRARNISRIPNGKFFYSFLKRTLEGRACNKIKTNMSHLYFHALGSQVVQTPKFLNLIYVANTGATMFFINVFNNITNYNIYLVSSIYGYNIAIKPTRTVD